MPKGKTYKGETGVFRRRFLRSRAQARYWCQSWQLTWEWYLTQMQTVPFKSIGRGLDQYNLIRRNKRQGWTPDNCELQLRSITVLRPREATAAGRIIRRKRRRDV